MIVQEGERKLVMAVIIAGVLLVGLLIILAFKQLSDGMWTAWCIAVAGDGLGYATANVVTKTIAAPKKNKR
jgi:hypothetical protein